MAFAADTFCTLAGMGADIEQTVAAGRAPAQVYILVTVIGCFVGDARNCVQRFLAVRALSCHLCHLLKGYFFKSGDRGDSFYYRGFE